jgi:hypothetical protein
MNNIKELLQKYFDGATSLEEENILQQYFVQTEIAEELKQYKPLFGCFAALEAETLPNTAFDEEFSKKVSVHRKHHGLVYHISLWSSAAAACVVLAMGSIYYIERQNNYMIVNGKRINDPEKALMIAADKLHLVTGKFNNSVSHVQQIRRVGKQLSVMEIFNKHDHSTDSLNTKNAIKTNEN